MHLLQPNTEYKKLVVTVVFPAILDDAEITDGMNEMLNGNIMDSSSGKDEIFVADWRFDGPHPAGNTDDQPEEGDLFLT